MSSWSKQIEQELDWRESELTSIKLLVVATKKDTIRYQALLRSLVVMLYAHYEGFCKFAWDLYLDGIKQQNLKRSDCCEAIKIFSLKKKFKEIGGNLSAESLWNFFITDLPNILDEDLTFEIELETQSNLWPSLLKSNLAEINLSCPMIDSHEIILKTLVRRRNSIAHGKEEIIKSLSDYEQYESATFDVMYELALNIIDSLEQQRYLKF